jgi:hypothetical protein
MSTVHSTPSTTAGQRSHPVGFNNQTNFDPFFPSSASEEFLTPIGSEYSSSHHSYQTPSPPQTLGSKNSSTQKSSAPPKLYNHLQPPSTTAFANGFESHTIDFELDREATGGAYDYLSPLGYASDNPYDFLSEHTATSSFGGNEFCLEGDYGLPVDTNQNSELDDHNPVLNGNLQQTQANHNIKSPQYTNHTRNSAGAATLSSHLMSPVLTEFGEPTSRHCTKSPSEEKRHIKSEDIETTLSMDDVAHGSMEDFIPVQITPSLTESSKRTSPDLSSALPYIARIPSPTIRVDGYSHEALPTGEENLLHPTGTKRRRAGSSNSYLSVHQDGDSEDEVHNNDSFSGAPHSTEQGLGRLGLDPVARHELGAIEIINLKEQDIDNQIALKNIDVEEWLGRSEPGREGSVDTPPRATAAMSRRQRAKSAGAQALSYANVETLKLTIPDSHIPGPGVLVYEESGDEEDDGDDELALIEDPPSPTSLDEPVNDVPGEAKPGVYDELPKQPPLYRAKLWQDPLYDSSDPGVKMQPDTANAAIQRYQQRAGDIETLSRVATWGTRRMSESDLRSLLHRFSFGDSAQEPVKEKRDRRGSFFQQLSGKLSSKRSNSNLKRQDSDKSIQSKEKPARPSTFEHSRNDSHGSRKESLGVPQAPRSGLKRMSSLSKRPKSPRINTSSAVAAMAFQAGALGAGRSVSATATSSPTGWPKKLMKGTKGRSELNALAQGPDSSSATDLGLAAMWTRQGGPPMPTLAAPALKTEETFNSLGEGEDDEDDDVGGEHGVTMDLSIRSDLIIPTLEGFKINVRQLNPRLPNFMFDRIAQEQLRRFKKLMDFKIKHIQALSIGKCASGKHCNDLGEGPTYLPSRSSAREPELTHTGFSVAGFGQSDEDVNALAEGIVTPAQFPPGVPMPPVKRLPAEFECSLCFKVKKFHKPSDWSKHVHEDVQPFTCTFENCAEPKSFKRKADWVRHENERHRQLEWWICNKNDCSHKCYRKDNFVQHLVREHKLTEPKIKTMKLGKPAVRGPSTQKARMRQAEDTEESTDDIDHVWKLVDECRQETPKNPKDEACKFCGNICNSWKKLTVHLAKHMEQISMPVLDVVKHKEVTPETIVSPIEQRMASQQNSQSPTILSPFPQRMISQQNSLSPTVQSPFQQPGQFNSIPQYGTAVGGLGGDVPAPFTPLQTQSNYYASMTPEHHLANYQRASPATYPPPTHAQQLGPGYNQLQGGSPGSPCLSDYGSVHRSSAPQFNPVNMNRGFSHPQTPSPDNMYGGSIRAPTSQPRTAAYNDGNAFQYVPQQQPNFSSPIDGNAYQFDSTTAPSYSQQQTAPPTSYPAQQQTDSPTSLYPQQQIPTSGQMPVPYNQMDQLQIFPPDDSNASLYNQQQQHYYGQQ